MKTHTSIIFLVIGLLGTLALICLGTLCYCAITGVQMQESLLTALIGMAGGLIGSLSSLLVNTRNQPADPTPAIVANKPDNPVPTEPVAPNADNS